MTVDAILKEILENSELRKKYWPEITPVSENSNTIIQSQNQYVESLHAIFSPSDNYRKTFIANLINK